MNAREQQLQNSTQTTIAGEACVSASTFLVVDLDSLTNVCGYFNSETPVNNYYGCNHKECGENEIVKICKDGSHKRTKNIEHKILLASLRKKYGSWSSILKASETEEGKNFINDIRHNKIHEHEFIAQFGCKLQGKCYSFSCPLANQCDLEDLKEYAPDLYDDWKYEEYDPSESGADLMLITDEPLIAACGYVFIGVC